MIRILKGADFSASNIGKIDIPETLPEYDDMIARFSNPSDEMSAKAKQFVRILVDNNIWGKIKYLMIPALASDASEAIQNLVLDDKILPSSVGNAVLEQDGLTFSAKGVLDLSTYIKPFTSNTAYSVGLALKSEDISGVETATIFSLAPAYASTIPYAYYLKGGKATVKISTSTTNIDGTNVIAGSISEEKVMMCYNKVNNNIYHKTLNDVMSASGFSLSSSTEGSYRNYFNQHLNVLLIADPLENDEQVFALKDAVSLFA